MQLASSIESFKRSLVGHGSADDTSIPESAFRPLGTLHLTLGVMHFSSPKKDKSVPFESLARDKNDDFLATGRDCAIPDEDENLQQSHDGVTKSKPIPTPVKDLDEAINFLKSLDLHVLLSQSTTSSNTRASGPAAGEAEFEPSVQVEEVGAERNMVPRADDKTLSPKSASQVRAMRKGDHVIGNENVSNIPQSLHRTISPPVPTRKENTAEHSVGAVSPITISLRGLDAFPSPSKATVLHARPHDSTERLLPFALALRQAFLDASLIAPEKRDLKLHASLVNTIYAGKDKRRQRFEKDGQGGGKGGRRKGEQKTVIDARELLTAFNYRSGQFAGIKNTARSEEGDGNSPMGTATEKKEFVWAQDVKIDRVQICKMGAKAVEDKELGQQYEVVYEKMILPTYISAAYRFASQLSTPRAVRRYDNQYRSSKSTIVDLSRGPPARNQPSCVRLPTRAGNCLSFQNWQEWQVFAQIAQ